jgi:hypothetical protein
MYIAIWTISIFAAIAAIALSIGSVRSVGRRIASRDPRAKSNDIVFEKYFASLASFISDDIGNVPATCLRPEDKLKEDLGYDDDDVYEILADAFNVDIHQLFQCNTLGDIANVLIQHNVSLNK